MEHQQQIPVFVRPAASRLNSRLLSVLAIGLAGAGVHAQVIVDWNTPNEGFSFGSWGGNTLDVGGTRQIIAPANGDGATGNGFTTDVSGVTDARFALTARLDAGIQSGLEIVLSPSATSANPAWLFFYSFDMSQFSEGVFTTATSPLLTTPSYVLDSANGYALVGSGSAFAPDLAQIGSVVVQGAGFLNSQAARFTFDTLAVVPEPTSILAVGLALSAFALRRRRM
jgi:hypothetical protein